MQKWFYFLFYATVSAVFLLAMFLLLLWGWKVLDSNNNLVCEDHYPCYTPAMQNISYKCGVEGSDDLWGTAMMKISKCIDDSEYLGYLEGIKGSAYYQLTKGGEQNGTK